MPSTTTKGYPYPVGTDRVMDGDDSIKSLAEAVDTKLGVGAAGVVTINVSASTPASGAVTFPVGRFTTTPVVVAMVLNSSAPQNASAASSGRDANGCTLWAFRTTAGNINVGWIAKTEG